MDHLLSKDDSKPRSAPGGGDPSGSRPSDRRDRRRHRPCRFAGGRRRLPTEVRPASRAASLTLFRFTCDRPVRDVARPGLLRGGPRLRLCLGEVSASTLGAGRGSLGLLRPLVSGQVGAARVRRGGDPGRDHSSALIASLTIRSSVTQASRNESLRGSGKYQSLSERAGRCRSVLSREGPRRTAIEIGQPATSDDVAGCGNGHRREVCAASCRSVR